MGYNETPDVLVKEIIMTPKFKAAVKLTTILIVSATLHTSVVVLTSKIAKQIDKI